MRAWVRNPHSGGVKIPERIKIETEKRIKKYADENFKGRFKSIVVRFKSQFCHIDSSMNDGNIYHLCRLRHFSEERWSVAFYAYSSMKYEPTFLDTGEEFGTPEEGFQSASIYLQD